MWFDGFESVNLQIMADQHWHESPPFDQFAEQLDRRERSTAVDALQPLGWSYEDQFGGAWQHRFEDIAERFHLDNLLPAVRISDGLMKSSVANEPPPDGSGDDIVVTATRRTTGGYTPDDEGGDDSDGYTGDPNGGGYGDSGGGGGDLPDDCQCSNLTDAQRREQNIDAEVAEVLAEILAQSNQSMEYGSLIWIDSSGVVRHTSLIETPDERARMNYSDLPTLPDGRTDFSGVVAMVHSHPQYIAYNNQSYFNGSDPDYLLYPWAGDWTSFDSHASLINSSGGSSSTFQNYIIGFDGNSLVINQYDASDRGTDTAASGDPVAANAEACTC